MSSADLQKLSEILNEFLDEDEAREFTSKIAQEVAENTSDEKLKSLLETLSSIYKVKPKRKEYLKKTLLALVVSLHMVCLLYTSPSPRD